MKEYAIEYFPVDLSKLTAERVSDEKYKEMHQNSVIPCHDVYIRHTYNNKDGILLVQRKGKPAKDLFWPIGGKLLRGVPTLESLNKKSLEECNLQLEDIVEIDNSRQFWQTDPFGHGRGTDTTSTIYYAKGKGELKLNDLHAKPTIITPKEYQLYRNSFHKYVKEAMDIIFYQGVFETGIYKKGFAGSSLQG
ncbi:MAG TPA: NUDIX domain-containing protein [Alphaproteobacteria bacterium]|nr:NUDIX domain-containing protein [Alphaproteobacteria bacterium]